VSQGEATKECPFCGESNKGVAVKCGFCGKSLDGLLREKDYDPVLQLVVPIGRSGWAIASGYLGLLSFFPLVGFVFGLLAIFTGIQARKHLRANPNLGGGGRAIFGIVAGILGVLLYGAILALRIHAWLEPRS
jgi:hypothetical protein